MGSARAALLQQPFWSLHFLFSPSVPHSQLVTHPPLAVLNPKPHLSITTPRPERASGARVLPLDAPCDCDMGSHRWVDVRQSLFDYLHAAFAPPASERHLGARRRPVLVERMTVERAIGDGNKKVARKALDQRSTLEVGVIPRPKSRDYSVVTRLDPVATEIRERMQSDEQAITSSCAATPAQGMPAGGKVKNLISLFEGVGNSSSSNISGAERSSQSKAPPRKLRDSWRVNEQ
jgi:hypothetical protein